MEEFIPARFRIVKKFKIDKPRFLFPEEFVEKYIFLTFDVPDDDIQNWRRNRGLPSIGKLLSYLKSISGEKDFELVLFKSEEKSKIEEENKKLIAYVNFDDYFGYARLARSDFKNIKINKKIEDLENSISTKIPEYFFSNKPAESLISEFKESKFKVYDEIFKTIDSLSEEERKSILDSFQHTKSGTLLVEKIRNLREGDPEIELKRFTKVIDKLGSRDFQELLDSILNSKISTSFLRELMKHIDTKSQLFGYIVNWMASLPEEKQKKIAKKLPEMIKLYDRFEKIRKSKEDFEKLIETHRKSESKDEKEIHKFIADNYWLLGVQYTDKKILTDLNEKGEYVHQTQFGRLRPDFEVSLENMDGTFDSAILIELEEANDRVFNQDGTLSYKVFDGINQAVKYCIEKRVEGKFVKGIAVIGSVGLNIDANQKKRLFHLAESFHNVEILTYEDIINRADATIKFFEEYRKRK